MNIELIRKKMETMPDKHPEWLGICSALCEEVEFLRKEMKKSEKETQRLRRSI